MPKNIQKVILLIALQFVISLSIIAILGFISQICEQIGYGKLGLYIVLTNSITGLLTSLFAPALFFKYKLKRIIVLAGLGTT